MGQADSAFPIVSVVIVNYKVPECLREAIRSLEQAEGFSNCEIIVVDNASHDNSEQIITSEFSFVQWIGLKTNIGFGKACNVGAQNARGEYILLLNPDTMVASNTLTIATNFLRTHPDIGIVGPKILNPDGTLQASCRRSFPTPSSALYHFLGLSKIFPKSKKFGHYNLSFLDPDEPAPVDAISGSCMFMRRDLYLEIGGFDERFFMYGEDLDICWKVKDAHKKVWYNPSMQIVHLKGKSSAKNQLKSRIAFYEAMVLFSNKHSATHGTFFPGWLIVVGIVFQAMMSIGANFLKSSTALFIDFIFINLTLWAGISMRFALFGMSSPYESLSAYLFLLHGVITVSFLSMYFYNGIYSKKTYTVKKALYSGALASVLFYATVYFIQSMAFSRVAFGISSVMVALVLPGWRSLLTTVAHGVKRVIFAPEKVIIVADGPIGALVIRNIEENSSGQIIGILWSADENRPGHFEGYPVLGTILMVSESIKKYSPDMLLIATNRPWYSFIIEALSVNKVKHLSIKWVPHEFFGRELDALPSTVPLKNFSV